MESRATRPLVGRPRPPVPSPVRPVVQVRLEPELATGVRVRDEAGQGSGMVTNDKPTRRKRYTQEVAREVARSNLRAIIRPVLDSEGIYSITLCNKLADALLEAQSE